MKSKPAVGRIGLGVVGLLLLAGLIYVGPSATQEGGEWALGILATALSILAGILIAVITLLGDPRNLHMGNWRVASVHRREIGRALNRFAYLFWLYLAVIALALAAVVYKGYAQNALEDEWVNWLRHVALSVGSVALLWSFSLPAVIRKAQRDRLRSEVERRREQRKSSPNDHNAGGRTA